MKQEAAAQLWRKGMKISYACSTNTSYILIEYRDREQKKKENGMYVL